MRVVRFFLGNLPLKIGAVLLAVILYVAMVALQSTQQWPGTIAIEMVNQPTTASLVDPQSIPPVSDIKYIAPADVPVSQSLFRATVDLASVKPSETDSSLVKVQLVAEDPRIQIIDYKPQQIPIKLEPIIRKQVTVVVDKGAVPSGLQPGAPTVTPSIVDVSGASSLVRSVAYAQASVRIDASGLDVNTDVDLVARDASNATVNGVQFNPRTVHVQMLVGSQIRTETVPVDPVITGTPAAGYVVTSIDVTPPSAAVSGQADALAALNGKANTKAISITGATGDVSQTVNLDLPNGVASGVGPISVVVHLSSPPTTRSVSLGVVPIGARTDLIYTLSTPSVIVTLGGATAALNAFDTSTLVTTVQVGGLDVGAHSLTVTVTVPPGIKVVTITPAQIVVTISAPPPPPASPSPVP
jgi:YbbR domain-containing protein